MLKLLKPTLLLSILAVTLLTLGTPGTIHADREAGALYAAAEEKMDSLTSLTLVYSRTITGLGRPSRLDQILAADEDRYYARVTSGNVSVEVASIGNLSFIRENGGEWELQESEEGSITTDFDAGPSADDYDAFEIVGTVRIQGRSMTELRMIISGEDLTDAVQELLEMSESEVAEVIATGAYSDLIYTVYIDNESGLIHSIVSDFDFQLQGANISYHEQLTVTSVNQPIQFPKDLPLQ